MKTACIAVSMILTATNVLAADTGYSNAAPQKNGDYTSALRHIDQGQYRDAIPFLRKVAKAEPDNADAYSLLGYSYRKSGDLEQSGTAYQRALSLDPRHLNALEYQGELFLMLDQIDKAEANLARISKQCFFVCEQERLLDAAIKKWRLEN